MSAVVVYLAEVNEITHLEVAQYSIEQFLSDVGGAAGLFMGMSMATVLGTFDCISMMVYESIILVSFDLFVSVNVVNLQMFPFYINFSNLKKNRNSIKVISC